MISTVDDTSIECCDKFNYYTPITPSLAPIVMIGIAVKTYHDHDKVSIKTKHKPKRYKHLTKHFDNTNEWLCMYGVLQPVNVQLKHLYHTLITTHNPTAEMYADIMALHGLTCETNYLLMRQNLIYIDMKHLDKVTNDTMYNTQDKLQEMLEMNDKYPWYINWCDLKLFYII